jgi:hypothetical protein
MSDDRMSELGRKAGDFLRKVAEVPAKASEKMGGGAPPPLPPGPGGGTPFGAGGIGGVVYEKPRLSPKGTIVEAQSDDSVTLRFRAALRTWWVLPYIMLPITIVGSIPLGLFIGTYMNPVNMFQHQSAWQGYFNTALWGTPVAMVIATYLVWRWTQPLVKVVANRQYIQVGSQYFERENYGGMRLGYEIETSMGLLKNDFHDLSIGLQGIRLSYGRWGEDLPYLVNSYHANEIVLWLNVKIGETEAAIAAPVSQTGNRPQSF